MSTSYAQTKRVQNLHLTRERDRRRGRELATFLLAGLPIACALLAYAALHIETVRVGYLREARQKTIATLNEEILEACVRQGEGDDDNSAVIREIRRRRDPTV